MKRTEDRVPFWATLRAGFQMMTAAQKARFWKNVFLMQLALLLLTILCGVVFRKDLHPSVGWIILVILQEMAMLVVGLGPWYRSREKASRVNRSTQETLALARLCREAEGSEENWKK